jgi:predicted Rossmann fold flavoprotein
MPMETVDLVVVGAGAAGLMAGIWAGRKHPDLRIVALDSAAKIGAKILVSGGGRCNVTHDQVDETAFAGSSRHAIRKVLRRFDVGRTIEFFRDLGVPLKREESGKLFPVTDRARTVLDALLGAARAVGVDLRHPRRVASIRREADGFAIAGPACRAGADAWEELRSARVILATGGMSLPKSGSDGHGYALARDLGHSITPRLLPALVPLTLEPGSFLIKLSGLSAPATLEVRSATGRRIIAITGAALLTHFGMSGPVVMDISRHYLDARHADPGARLVANWLPGESASSIDAMLRVLGERGPGRAVRERMPERLARALCLEAGVDPSAPGRALTKQRRRALADLIAATPLPVTGTRGFDFAEVTAGGVPLREIDAATMASRVCPGLSLCGEICDVDGRIGGFNFQWAWASGYVAGISAVR